MENFLALVTGSEITLPVCAVRLFLSFLTGCVLGLERKYRTQFVGMRTLTIICVSSSLLMMLSIYMSQLFPNSPGDPSRMAAQVVSGIGFLGGGAILRHGFNVKGLTSAANIWTVAALGLAIGSGFIIPAAIALLICLLSLICIEYFEERVFPADQLKTLQIICDRPGPEIKALEGVAAEYSVVITGLQATSRDETSNIVLTYDIRMPKHLDFDAFSSHLLQIFSLHSITVE